MIFRDDTPVYTADGRHIGDVAGVVIEPDDEEAVQLILDKGVLFKTARVIGMQMVAEATEERVTLLEGVAPENLALFEERRYLPLGSSAVRGPNSLQTYVWYAPFEATTLDPNYLAELPGGAQTIVHNIPPDSVAVETGTEVTSSDGRRVGKVEEVITTGGTVTGFVVERGVMFPESRAIPIAWVGSMDQHSGLKLRVDSSTLEAVPARSG